MSVVFSQPEAIGTAAGAAAAQAGGAAPATERLADMYARLAGQNTSQQGQQLAASSRTLAGNEQAQEHAAALNQQAILQSNALQARQQEQEKAQAFQAAQQENAWTYADSIHMNRLQGGLTQLKQQRANGLLTEEEFQEGASHLYGVLGPMTLAKQAADERIRQTQLKEINQQAEMQATHAKTFQDFVAAGKPPVQELPNGGMIVYDSKGNAKYHPPEKDTSQDTQLKLDEALNKREQTAVESWHKHMLAIEESVDKHFEARIKAGTVSAEDAYGSGQNAGVNRQAAIDAKMKALGMPRTEDEVRQNFKRANGRGPAANEGSGQAQEPMGDVEQQLGAIDKMYPKGTKPPPDVIKKYEELLVQKGGASQQAPPAQQAGGEVVLPPIQPAPPPQPQASQAPLGIKRVEGEEMVKFLMKDKGYSRAYAEKVVSTPGMFDQLGGWLYNTFRDKSGGR